MKMLKMYFFFLSSRRRHTIYWRDWSFRRVLFRSYAGAQCQAAAARRHDGGRDRRLQERGRGALRRRGRWRRQDRGRSEERRVGKECRFRRSPYHLKKKNKQ